MLLGLASFDFLTVTNLNHEILELLDAQKSYRARYFNFSPVFPVASSSLDKILITGAKYIDHKSIIASKLAINMLEINKNAWRGELSSENLFTHQNS